MVNHCTTEDTKWWIIVQQRTQNGESLYNIGDTNMWIIVQQRTQNGESLYNTMDTKMWITIHQRHTKCEGRCGAVGCTSDS